MQSFLSACRVLADRIRGYRDSASYTGHTSEPQFATYKQDRGLPVQVELSTVLQVDAESVMSFANVQDIHRRTSVPSLELGSSAESKHVPAGQSSSPSSQEPLEQEERERQIEREVFHRQL